MSYNRLQDLKIVQFVFGQAIKDDAAFVGAQGATPVSVDTKGYEEARVVIAIGSIDATIAAMNVFDSDDDSTYTEIPGLDFTTDTTDPGASDDNKVYAAFIDLKNKKRYLQIALTAGNGAAGTYATAHVDLAKGEAAPDTAAERGLADQLFA